MIRSVAGEPPQAFRRRILVERAAYRMVTTSAPLVDIAVEAGYGSHEAFTRAFTRAGLRLPSRDEVNGMELVTKMVEQHVWLTGEMVRVAGRLDDQQLDRQIEVDVDDDVQTIRSLLSRLVGRMGMWNAALATRDPRLRLVGRGARVVDLVALALASHGVDELGWGDPMLWVAQPGSAPATG